MPQSFVDRELWYSARIFRASTEHFLKLLGRSGWVVGQHQLNGSQCFRWRRFLGEVGKTCVEVRFRTEPLTAEQGWPLSCNKNNLGFSVRCTGWAKVGLDALPAASLAFRLPELIQSFRSNCRPGSFLVMQGCQSCIGMRCQIWNELKVNEFNDMNIYWSKTLWFLILFFHWEI